MNALDRAVACSILLASALTAGQNQAPGRNISFNGRQLNSQEMARLEAVERRYRVRLPNGRFWYDNVSGAIGVWKGPVAGFALPGLNLGPRMPPDCSTGGTGVFVNGRELHPIDVMALRQFMLVLPGRWWVDAYGNGGAEGSPATFNLVALARQASSRGSRGSAWSRRLDAGGGSVNVGGDGSFFYFMDSNGNAAYSGN